MPWGVVRLLLFLGKGAGLAGCGLPKANASLSPPEWIRKIDEKQPNLHTKVRLALRGILEGHDPDFTEERFGHSPLLEGVGMSELCVSVLRGRAGGRRAPVKGMS